MQTEIEVDHFIPHLDFRTKTLVKLEVTNGVFQSLTIFSAFDGEVNIFIHGSHGHKSQFCVVIVRCDDEIMTKHCDAMEECLNYIDGASDSFKWEGSWWKPVREWAEKLLIKP